MPYHWNSHEYDENVQDGVRNGRCKMKLLGLHAEAFLIFGTLPVICGCYAANEQKAEEECNTPCAYDRHHSNGTPISHACCSSVEDASVERHDAEFDETQSQSLLQFERP